MNDGTMVRTIARLAACAENEIQALEEAVRIFTEQTGISAEKAADAVMKMLQRVMAGVWEMEMLDALQCELLDFTTARERKKAREKRRMVERGIAYRFCQYKTREKAWTARKRTGARQREWRGPWRAEKD